MSENRRRFHRIQFDCTATLEASGNTHATQLLDISLNGALLTRPPGWDIAQDASCVVRIALDPDNVEIRMEGKVAHRDNDRLGIHCEHLDIESAGHLRRIVELNLGDSELLNRELLALI